MYLKQTFSLFAFVLYMCSFSSAFATYIF